MIWEGTCLLEYGLRYGFFFSILHCVMEGQLVPSNPADWITWINSDRYAHPFLELLLHVPAFCTKDVTSAEKGSLSLRPLTCQSHSDVPVALLVFKCTPEFPGLAIAHCHGHFTRAIVKDAGYFPLPALPTKQGSDMFPRTAWWYLGNSLNYTLSQTQWCLLSSHSNYFSSFDFPFCIFCWSLSVFSFSMFSQF